LGIGGSGLNNSMRKVRIGQNFAMPWVLVLMLAMSHMQRHGVISVLAMLKKLWIFGQGH